MTALRTWSDVETAWLSGLLEGEGSFGIYSRGPASKGRLRRARVSLEMTDEDVVLKVAELIGAASVTARRSPPLTAAGTPRRPAWGATVNGAQAIEVMRRVRPFMGARRAARIDEITSEWLADRPQLTTSEEAA